MSANPVTPAPIPPVVVQAGDGKVFQFPSAAAAQQFETEARAAGGETQRLEPAPPAAARPLYSLEQHLSALVDTEDLVSEDQEREYALELHATLLATVEKRDRVAQFIGWLKSQVSFAHAERQRLKAREQFYQRALDRMEDYVTRVIESLGYDGKKRKRLQGATSTMWLHGCAKRVDVFDIGAVPSKYKRVTIVLPADTWETICDSLYFDLREQVLDQVKLVDTEVSASLAGDDLKAEIPIEGCKLAGGTYLVVD